MPEITARHTPGPWNQGQGHDNVVYHESYPIAWCTTGEGADWCIPNPLGQDVARANAALVVKAPAMEQRLEYAKRLLLQGNQEAALNEIELGLAGIYEEG